VKRPLLKYRPRPARRKLGAQRGSALVEVLVSVLLFSVSIIALLRVLGTSVRDSGDLEYRAVAANIADAVIGQMWVDRGALASYVVTDATVTDLPNGTLTVALPAANLVTVTVNWQPPGAISARTHTVTATLAAN
jgi:type IV pilus assembly protein PilV